jgi:D-alanine-D-alanine ligase
LNFKSKTEAEPLAIEVAYMEDNEIIIESPDGTEVSGVINYKHDNRFTHH